MFIDFKLEVKEDFMKIGFQMTFLRNDMIDIVLAKYTLSLFL